MAELADYLVKISAKTSGLNEASQHLVKLEKQVAGLAKRLAFAMIGFRGITQLLYKAASAIKAEAKETIKLNDTLEQAAKSLKKTTEQARLHQVALSAMGKTMQEINKDDELKKTYDELIKIGEAFEFKKAPDGVTRIQDITNEFTKLKFTFKLGLSQVYEWFKVYASKPLLQLRGWLRDLREQLLDKAGEVAKKVGHALAVVFKEALRLIKHLIDQAKTVIKWVGGIIDWFKNLGTEGKIAITGITAALALLTGAIKPVTLLIMGLWLLFDDFVTWQNGGASLFGDAWQQVIDVFETLWDVIQTIWWGVSNLVTGIYNAIADIVNLGNALGIYDFSMERMEYKSFDELKNVWSGEESSAPASFGGAESGGGQSVGAGAGRGSKVNYGAAYSDYTEGGNVYPNYVTGGDVNNSNNVVTVNTNASISVQSPSPMDAANQVNQSLGAEIANQVSGAIA